MDQQILHEQKKRWQTCLAKLLYHQPFWATLGWGLDHVPASVGTACTDGKTLYWDPEFTHKYCTLDDHVIFLIAHEIGHPMLGHPWRAKPEWDHDRANRAGDYEINGILKRAGFTLLPGALVDSRFDQMAFEQIYAVLDTEEKDKSPGDKGASGEGDGDGGDEGGDGPESDGSGKKQSKKDPPKTKPDPNKPGSRCGQFTQAPLDEHKRKMAKDEWERRIVQAVAVARGQGSMPAGLEQIIDDVIHPKISWVELLREYITRSINMDYNWMKPNKRYIGCDLFLPTQHSKAMGTVVVLGDCSGSMWNMVNMVMGHVQDILESCKPEKLVFVPFDTEVHAWIEIEPGDDIPRKAYGGGGSCCLSAFKKVDEMAEPPAVCIVVTDGYLNIPQHAPEYPVIWAMTTDVKFDWGDTVRVEQ